VVSYSFVVLRIKEHPREEGEKRMSAKDLISKWEDALTQVLTSHLEPENAGEELAEEDLRSALGAYLLKSAVRAGAGESPDSGADKSCYIL